VTVTFYSKDIIQNDFHASPLSFDLDSFDVDADWLQFFALRANVHARTASNPDLNADSTSHADSHTDAFSHTRLRLVPVEACLV